MRLLASIGIVIVRNPRHGACLGIAGVGVGIDDFQLAEPMQASGRELGQEPDESEVGLLEDSTDKVGEEATQGELEGANQETEATPSEVYARRDDTRRRN